MKKIILSALLCVAVVPTISAVKNPEILTSGTLKIPLVNFYPDTDQLFYTESIRPLEPYRIFKLWDQNQKLRDIRQTIYNFTHAKTIKNSVFAYPETLKFLCPPNFLENLTTAGKNVYLSVLADYATRLTGKIDYQAQRAYAHEKIPQQIRFALWRILAQHVVFTPEFAQKKDSGTNSGTISKLLDNTLFSVLCYDREEAGLINPQDRQIATAPLKIYVEETLLTRPTDLDLLAQTLYLLTPEAPTWTVTQAAAAIGLKRLFEGKELPVKTERKAKKSKFQQPELEILVENIPNVPESTTVEEQLDKTAAEIEERTKIAEEITLPEF